MFDPISLAVLGGTALARLFGAHSASNAAKDAAKIQADSAQKAIDLQKQLYGQQQADFAPYLKTGQGAATQLGSLLTGMTPPPQPKALQYGQSQVPPMGAQAQMAAPATITVIAPDGSTAQRPASERAHWLQKGAQVQ